MFKEYWALFVCGAPAQVTICPEMWILPVQGIFLHVISSSILDFHQSFEKVVLKIHDFCFRVVLNQTTTVCDFHRVALCCWGHWHVPADYSVRGSELMPWLSEGTHWGSISFHLQKAEVEGSLFVVWAWRWQSTPYVQHILLLNSSTTAAWSVALRFKPWHCGWDTFACAW